MKRYSGQQQSIITTRDTVRFTNYAFDHSEENHRQLEAHKYFDGSTHSSSVSESADDLDIGGDGSPDGVHLPGTFLSHFESVSVLEGKRVSPEGRIASSRVHDFNPTSRPNNPLSKVLVPFRMMKPLVPKSAPKAAAVWMSQPVVATRGLLNRFGTRTKIESSPPAGYVWLWRSILLGWRRRFLVTSPEAPRVVMIYKDSSLKGKVLSVSLSDATVEGDEQDARQLKIVTHTKGKIFIRASNEPERNDWVACLHNSILSSSRGVTQPTTPSECGNLVRASSNDQPAIQDQEVCGDSVRASSNDQATIQDQDVHGDPFEASSTAPPEIAPYECGHPVIRSFNILPVVQEGGDLVECLFGVLSAGPSGAGGSGGASGSIHTGSGTGLAAGMMHKVVSSESFISSVTYAETARDDTFDHSDLSSNLSKALELSHSLFISDGELLDEYRPTVMTDSEVCD
eukprot:gene26190-11916_t